jgi:tetratricopeptide (TPR) repeat protein
MEAEPPDVRSFNSEVPAGLWAVLQRMLAKDSDDRYQTPAELLAALREQAPGARPGPAAKGSGAALPSPPAEAPRPRRKKRRPAGAASPPPAGDSSAALGLSSAEHIQAAAGQFERAREVADSGNPAYALELLFSCCKLDPANLLYRKTLREVAAAAREQRRGGWLKSLGALAVKTRLKAARQVGDHRKVLAHGEEVLARQPDDLRTHMDMAEAAAALSMNHLAVWLLEQAHARQPRDPEVQRALARLYEKQKQYPEAIALWEKVRQAVPHDPEAGRKINDLSVRDTLSRGRYAR